MSEDIRTKIVLDGDASGLVDSTQKAKAALGEYLGTVDKMKMTMQTAAAEHAKSTTEINAAMVKLTTETRTANADRKKAIQDELATLRTVQAEKLTLFQAEQNQRQANLQAFIASNQEMRKAAEAAAIDVNSKVTITGDASGMLESTRAAKVSINEYISTVDRMKSTMATAAAAHRAASADINAAIIKLTAESKTATVERKQAIRDEISALKAAAAEKAAIFRQEQANRELDLRQFKETQQALQQTSSTKDSISGDSSSKVTLDVDAAGAVQGAKTGKAAIADYLAQVERMKQVMQSAAAAHRAASADIGAAILKLTTESRTATGDRKQAILDEINTLRQAQKEKLALFRQEQAARNVGLQQFKSANQDMRQGAEASGKDFRALSQRLQNASYQVGDFLVQVQGGQDPFRALGQQLPQLLIGFGLVGAAISVLTTLIPIAASQFKKFFFEFDKNESKLADFAEGFEDMAEKVKKPIDVFLKVAAVPSQDTFTELVVKGQSTGTMPVLVQAIKVQTLGLQEQEKDLEKYFAKQAKEIAYQQSRINSGLSEVELNSASPEDVGSRIFDSDPRVLAGINEEVDAVKVAAKAKLDEEIKYTRAKGELLSGALDEFRRKAAQEVVANYEANQLLIKATQATAAEIDKIRDQIDPKIKYDRELKAAQEAFKNEADGAALLAKKKIQLDNDLYKNTVANRKTEAEKQLEGIKGAVDAKIGLNNRLQEIDDAYARNGLAKDATYNRLKSDAQFAAAQQQLNNRLSAAEKERNALLEGQDPRADAERKIAELRARFAAVGLQDTQAFENKRLEIITEVADKEFALQMKLFNSKKTNLDRALEAVRGEFDSSIEFNNKKAELDNLYSIAKLEKDKTYFGKLANLQLEAADKEYNIRLKALNNKSAQEKALEAYRSEFDAKVDLTNKLTELDNFYRAQKLEKDADYYAKESILLGESLDKEYNIRLKALNNRPQAARALDNFKAEFDAQVDFNTKKTELDNFYLAQKLEKDALYYLKLESLQNEAADKEYAIQLKAFSLQKNSRQRAVEAFRGEFNAKIDFDNKKAELDNFYLINKLEKDKDYFDKLALLNLEYVDNERKIRQRALTEQARDQQQFYTKLDGLIEGFTGQFSDRIADAMAGGKLSFDGLLTDFTRSITKFLLDDAFQTLFKSLKNAGSDGTFSSGIGSLFSGLFGGGGGGGGGIGGFFSSLFGGGGLSDKLSNVQMGRMAIPQPNTASLSAGDFRANLVKSMQGKMSSSGVAGADKSTPEPKININVINNNNSDVKTETRQNSNGGIDIDVMIAEKVKTMFNNGTLDKTMSSNYGMGRRGQ